MDRKGVLYFEEDDASNLSENGKHVFLTKRINGKTTHNKLQEERKKIIEDNKKEDYDLYEDIIIGVNNASFLEKQEQEKKRTKSSKNKTSNSNKKNKNKSNSNQKNKNKSKLAKDTDVTEREFKNKQNANKAKKKKKKKLKMLKICVLLFIILGVIIFAMISPVFNITTITVSGNERVRTDTIISLSGLNIGNNIFRNSKKQIKQNIKDNQYIEVVNIKRQLPGTIEIEVEERKVAYQIKVIDSYVYTDYQGYILETANQKENVPIIEGLVTSNEELLNNKRVNNEDISTLNTILKIMDSAKNIEISSKITTINVEDPKDYILYLKSEKKYIHLGDGTNLNNKMLYVQIILQDEKGTKGEIFVNGDLNNGFKPYFR